MATRLFVLLFCLFMLLNSREPPWADAHLAYATAESIVDRHAVDVTLDAPAYFFAVRDGKKYGYAMLGNALSLVPSYAAYKALRKLHVFPEQPLYALTSHLSSALLMAGAVSIFFTLCRRRGESPRTALLLSLTLALCTICFIYARSPYGEALQTFGMMFLLERTLAQAQRMTRAGMAGLGLAAGILFIAKLAYAPTLLFCAIYVLYGYARAAGPRRIRDLIVGVGLALAAFAPFVALCLWHNNVKTGSLWNTGYREGSEMWAGDFCAAFYGYTLSSGKSLFLYSPPVLLGLLGLRTAWRQRRDETILLLLITGGLIALNSKFYYWHGDYAWGPRYMVPLTPIFLYLALPWLPQMLSRAPRRPWLRQAALGFLLTAGLFVQGLGAALYWDHYIRIVVSVREQTSPRGWAEGFISHGYFVPHFSPVWGHYWLLSHLIRHDPNLMRDAPFRPLVSERIVLGWQWERLRLDYWPLDWTEGKKNRQLGALWFLLFAAGAGLSASSLRRRLG